MPSRTTTPRRTRGFIAGGLVAAALVVAGVGVSLGAALNGSHQTAMTTPPPARAAAAAGGSTCGLRGLDTAGTTLTTAPATTWTIVGTMAAPSSSTSGPGRVQADGFRSCYAHTVAGAVLAVANFWATGSDPRLYRQIVQHNVADGTGRTKALEAAGGPSNTGTSAQIAAFTVRVYRPTAATIDVALQTSSGQQVGFPVPVTWQDGDWKVQLADNGTALFRPTILQNLAGYIPWAGTE